MTNILIVDDSNYARRTMRRTLEEAHHNVIEASSGMAAIEQYFVAKPDLVLLDLTMEDVSGIEVLEKLREMDPDAKVIVVSADVQASTAGLVMAAGAVTFLGKPVQTEELLETIAAVMGGASK